MSELYGERLGQEFEMVMAADAESAQQMLQNKEEQIELLLLDIMLPRMSGLDLLAWVREQKEIAKLPVVLITALDTEEDRARGKALGADMYLAKSGTTPEKIVEKLNNLLVKEEGDGTS